MAILSIHFLEVDLIMLVSHCSMVNQNRTLTFQFRYLANDRVSGLLFVMAKLDFTLCSTEQPLGCTWPATQLYRSIHEPDKVITHVNGF
jgi:hypothetical protein